MTTHKNRAQFTAAARRAVDAAKAATAARRLGVTEEWELLAALAAALPVNHGIAYLTGGRHARSRATVMQAALRRRVTQSEAGINNLRAALQGALGIEPGCIMSVEREIARLVSEHRKDEAKKATMSADDILAIWRRF